MGVMSNVLKLIIMKNIVIIPAALSDSEEELKKQIEKISPLSPNFHLDYCDGEFVDNQTVDWQYLMDLPEYYPDKYIYLHLMCQEPLSIARAALTRGFYGVTLHIEALGEGDIDEIKELKKLGKIGLALKLETPVSALAPYSELVDSMTVMTIKSGGQGRKFHKDGLEKIKELKKMGYTGDIIADGSINKETITSVVKAGANTLVVGSALTQAEDPKKVYDEMQERINLITKQD